MKTKFLAIGDNGWGKGDTVEEAVAMSGMDRDDADIYLIGQDDYIDDDGNLIFQSEDGQWLRW